MDTSQVLVNAAADSVQVWVSGVVDPWQAFWNGAGIFGGIVVGILVQLGVNKLQNRKFEVRKVNHLKSELKFNVAKIDVWLGDMGKLRECIMGDVIATFYGYFDLSKALFVTANDMLSTGLLYEKLEHTDIEKLQYAVSVLSPSNEVVYSKAIGQWQQTLDVTRLDSDGDISHAVKEGAVKQVDFWLADLKEHRKALSDIADKL
jgi:hypothetical protein